MGGERAGESSGVESVEDSNPELRFLFFLVLRALRGRVGIKGCVDEAGNEMVDKDDECDSGILVVVVSNCGCCACYEL